MSAVLLGVTLCDTLISFTAHVDNMLKICSQRLYLLKLREKGLPRHYLNAIFDALVLSKLQYMQFVFGVVSCQPKWLGRSMHFSSVHLSMASVSLYNRSNWRSGGGSIQKSDVC